MDNTVIRLDESVISIITVTLGRWHYLQKQVIALQEYEIEDVEHIIVAQNCTIPEYLKNDIKLYKKIKPRIIESCGKVDCIGEVLNQVIPDTKGDLIVKLDDDALPSSPCFLSRIVEVNKLIPNSIFSPYPVGLISNPGGVPGSQHSMIYSKKYDLFFTLRHVHHVGGFARIAPKSIYERIKFNSVGHTEDGEFSTYCRNNRIPMYYLENSIIVEHQESTLGQHERESDYFKGRF